MNKQLSQYQNTPVGQQLSVHFSQRAELRRTIPLFPFSIREIFKKASPLGNSQISSNDGFYHQGS